MKNFCLILITINALFSIAVVRVSLGQEVTNENETINAKRDEDFKQNNQLIANEGSDVSFKCPTIVADPDENKSNNKIFEQKEPGFLIVQWFKDSARINKLTSSPRYKIINKNLIIKRVDLSDAGQFKCKLINGFGNAVYTFELIVKGRVNKSLLSIGNLRKKKLIILIFN
jgi:hypothetical protein